MQQIDIKMETGPALRQALAAFDRFPAEVKKATATASRRTETAIRRIVTRAVAKSVPMKQTNLTKARRVVSSRVSGDIGSGLEIWIGLNPIPVHWMGAASWTPYRGAGSRPKSAPRRPGKPAAGAKVRGETFPGAWSWKGGKTGPLVMERTGRFGRRGNARLERIDVVRKDIAEKAVAAVNGVTGKIMGAFDEELRRALKHQIPGLYDA